MGHAYWSGLSLYHQHVFHFPVLRNYFECFENPENKAINRKTVEKASYTNGSKYNYHHAAQHSGTLFDGALNGNGILKQLEKKIIRSRCK